MAEKFIVETSARHIHVTEEQFKILFGADAVMHKKKDLSQPGQFAAEERLDVVGPKKTIPNISILGPARKAAQVEVSFTDAVGNVFLYTVAELETLGKTDVEEMQAGDWDLTLFTCTYGGKNRVTVRCVPAEAPLPY